MNTVNATFVNSIDFWMSFGFGTSAAIALISVYSTVRDVIKRGREAKKQAAAGAAATDDSQSERDKAVSSLWKTPSIGRGDWPIWVCVVGYLLSSTILVTLCNALVPGILGFLIFFVVFYNPFISYVNARLLGLTGQHIDIPFIREGCFILSGYNKLDIWLAPVPLANYGAMAQSFRVNELTGVRFRSLIFTDLVAVPTAFLLSFFFWGFIWKANAIPSDIYPAAQLNWELQAKSTTLLYSATFHPESEAPTEDATNSSAALQPSSGAAQSPTAQESATASGGRADMSEAANRFADTEFAKALHPKVIATGATLTILLFTLFSVFGLPTLFIYGMIRGFGSLPHGMVLEIVGAVLGRWYFQKKFGKKNFLRSAPALAAGYATGVGLIGMLTIAMNLIKNAVSSAPF
jgi:hypothetical protein